MTITCIKLANKQTNPHLPCTDCDLEVQARQSLSSPRCFGSGCFVSPREETRMLCLRLCLASTNLREPESSHCLEGKKAPNRNTGVLELKASCHPYRPPPCCKPCRQAVTDFSSLPAQPQPPLSIYCVPSVSTWTSSGLLWLPSIWREDCITH